MSIKYTKDGFIKKSNLIHNNFYDYSLVEYINSRTKVKIICKEHGIFQQIPKDHIFGHGCSLCGKNKKSNKLLYDNNTFVEKSKKIHGDKYDYSLVDYKNNHTKVKIICSIHGIFEQKPNNHLQGSGCPKCKKNYKMDKISFIEKSNLIHNNFYDYSLVDYNNNKEKIKIICPIHGIFEQRPDMHIQNQGCPNCNESKGEKNIKKYLIKNNIKYIYQKRFKDCKYIKPLPFDFYLPDYNICIEYDGVQHFKLKEHWGGEKEFKKIKERDKIKNEYCKNNNINLIRIKYSDNLIDILNKIK